MLVLGIESSCDETGVALYDTDKGLLAQALHSQADMHERYGGVVPELASRDHIERLTPLLEGIMEDADRDFDAIDAIAYTQGPGLAGALLVGASVASALAFSLDRPIIGIHHLEGHLLSPLLSNEPPDFPFVALLVSGGHTQLLRVDGLGQYTLLGETVDDAAGEAFDKSAKLLDLGYPGGPALARLAATAGDPNRPDAPAFRLPRPKLKSDDLDFSFSGLKTAVLTQVKKGLADEHRADLAREVEEAITDVLVGKALKALAETGLHRLVISGGVSANQRLRAKLAEAARKRPRNAQPLEIHFPELALCTDNGAMIAFAGALRLQAQARAQAAALRTWNRRREPPQNQEETRRPPLDRVRGQTKITESLDTHPEAGTTAMPTDTAAQDRATTGADAPSADHPMPAPATRSAQPSTGVPLHFEVYPRWPLESLPSV